MILVLDSDEEAELETTIMISTKPRSVKAPKVSRHIQRRHSGCRPKRLFVENDNIVVDEVQATERTKKLRRLAKKVICTELWDFVKTKCADLCYGCSVDHPSQLQHDWCVMASDEERVDMFLDDAIKNLDYENIFSTKYLSQCCALKINIPSFVLWEIYYYVYRALRAQVNVLRRIMLRIIKDL